MKRLAICCAILVCFACAHADPTTQPTTAPSTVLKLSDAVDLVKLSGDREPYMSHQLRLSGGPGTIYFGTLDTWNDNDEITASLPILARKTGGDWLALPVADARLKNAAWVYVGAGPNRGEAWGVLDASLDDDQADLVLAHSTDSGTTFAITAIKKPTPAADFDSFCIGPDGKGRITLYLAAEHAGQEKPGYYHLRTSDAGKTWSAAQYEPDAMSPAKDVPGEDQPEGALAPNGKA